MRDPLQQLVRRAVMQALEPTVASPLERLGADAVRIARVAAALHAGATARRTAASRLEEVTR